MSRNIIGYAVIVIGAAMVAAGINLFLIPHQLLSGGVSGIAMLVGYYSEWNIGILYFLFNFPIMLWGWFIIGRRFIILSILSVFLTSWFMQLINVDPFINDPILGSVFGGVLIGIGTGITLRVGGSTGGFDIIGSILTRKRDFPLGMVMFLLNGLVILCLGFLDNWDSALYSMLTIYIAGKIVDTIHIRHVKVTAFIITNETKEMIKQLLLLPRGVTIIKTQGAFSHTEKDMLMTVTTRYELAQLLKIIREIDQRAFVNIVETVGVLGEFTRNN
ncbi:MAG: YitT family protein [Paenibacillaceae bacterium]